MNNIEKIQCTWQYLLRLYQCYSIHVPGRLLKWLNWITTHGSVGNEPGSVVWLATKYLKTVSLRNHTEKLNTLWPQNISFWPKINIPSSYFRYFNAKLLGKYSQTLLWQLCNSCQIIDLINFQNNLTWLNSNTAGISLDSTRLKYSKITHMYAKDSPFTWFLYWKLPIDTDFIHFICQFHQSVELNARKCFDGPAAPQRGMLGALIVWWPASFRLQWTMAEGTVHVGSPAKFPTKPRQE